MAKEVCEHEEYDILSYFSLTIGEPDGMNEVLVVRCSCCAKYIYISGKQLHSESDG